MDAGGSSLENEHKSALAVPGSAAAAFDAHAAESDAFDADIFVDMPDLGASYIGAVPSGGSSILQRNLEAVRASCAQTAQLIEQASPRADIVFIETDDGVLSGTIGVGDEARSLASKRRPLAEAEKLAAGFDVTENGAAAVLGFGLGHHVKALAQRIQKQGVVLCFEPDIALLRSVFERIDHSQWMTDNNVAIFTDPSDASLVSARLKGIEPIVALGTKFIHHTPSRPRLGPMADEFGDNIALVLRAIRTSLVTTLLQVEVTQRNLLQNIDHYATSPGVTDLENCCKGKPAIVVSAGPSLARNIHHLKQPGVRDRFVIVAAQTVLKQLLREGIKPHFITALDYHEISKRFYEGLTAEDVQGVTLIAEAKANPAILDAFPGQIRIPDDKYLTAVFGEDLYTKRGELTPGATVAHLAYYVARHMGCDPVVLVGQDLGFTDGQYYASGAAIHKVWSGELGAFNTLEMMEWQRIVRGRRTLHKTKDTLGRPVYSDEQMLTYLTQFERDFLNDTNAGLAIIDATEGGVAKRHTQPMTLENALEQFMPETDLAIPEPPRERNDSRLKGAHARVRLIRRDIARVASLSRECKSLLMRMLDTLDDTPALNDLIRRIDRLKARVLKLDPAYALVQQLNQTGALNRLRADRRITLSGETSGVGKQRLQIERDKVNVQWLADAADQLGKLFDDANATLCGSPKVTRAHVADDELERKDNTSNALSIWAIIPVDTAITGLGVKRNLATTQCNGRNILSQTLAQLGKTETLTNVAILTDEPSKLAAIIGRTPPNLTIEYITIPEGAVQARARAMAGARRWAADAWRGGLGSLTCYDEVFDPSLVDAAMERLNIDAAVVLGPDWAMIDPALTDQVVRRHLERPESHKIVFAHVPPGLAPCLIERTLVGELAREAETAGVFATLGALVGYVPLRPQADPIVKPLCVRTNPDIRDLGVRCIVDQPRARQLAEHAESPAKSGPSNALDQLAITPTQPSAWPAQLTIELTTTCNSQGLRKAWRGDPVPAQQAEPDWIMESIKAWCDCRPDAALTLAGRGDPLLHPHWQPIVHAAKECGAAVHLRTDLTCDNGTIETLLASDIDVISIDLLADSAETYVAITGQDEFGHVTANIESLINRRPTARGLPLTWILPRITRCDATYEEIEPFFDRWVMQAGCAMIDPLPIAISGQRIEPITTPPETRARRHATELCIRADGSAVIGLEPAHANTICNVRATGLQAAWQAVLAARVEPNQRPANVNPSVTPA